MQILLLAGSSRPHSNSLLAARFLGNLLHNGRNDSVQIVDLSHEALPAVGRGSLDVNQLTPFQQELTEAWGKARLVIITAPEYNWSTNAELINMAHQLGTKAFAPLFKEKVFAFAGVSTGRGGRQSALELMMIFNKIISFSDSESVVCPKLWESHETHRNIDAASLGSANEVYTESARQFLTYALRLSRRWERSESNIP